MFINEIYGKVKVGQALFDMFPNKSGLKHGDV